jgi:hypothetical protein
VLPGAPSAPLRPARARVDRSLLAPILALLAVGTSWLPWLKSPVAGLFDLSGSGLERTVNAWDLPARAVWSYHAPRGGPSLGWLIVGIALGVVVLVVLGARTAARWLGAVEAVLAVMFLVQLTRIVEDSPSIGSTDIGVTDLAGIGVYLLLVIGFALVLVPRA